MKRTEYVIWAALIMFIMVMPMNIFAHDDHGKGDKKLFTKHFQESLFDVTQKATFSVEVILDEKEYKIGRDAVGVVLHDDRDEDVVGARLVIVQKNLRTGEQAPGAITVADKGNGLYIVSGLDLELKGRWELTITAIKNGTEDGVKFVFPDVLEKRNPKGKYSP